MPRLELDPAVPLPLSKPLNQTTLALVSSAGLSQSDQPPMDGANYEGDYMIRLLDVDRDPNEVAISHTHFEPFTQASWPGNDYEHPRLGRSRHARLPGPRRLELLRYSGL